MDKIRLSTELSDPYDGVNIYINDCNLIDILKEVELTFAKKEDASQIAGSYQGLSPDTIFLPSRHLLGEPNKKYDYYHGKIILYECGNCGMDGCWSFLIKITLEKDKVIWHDFEQPHRDSTTENEWRYDSIEPFVFDREQYELEIKSRHKEKEKNGHYIRYVELPIPSKKAYDLSILAIDQIKNCKIYDQASAFRWIKAKTGRRLHKNGQLISINVTNVDMKNSIIEVSSKPVNPNDKKDLQINLENVEKIIEFLKSKV